MGNTVYFRENHRSIITSHLIIIKTETGYLLLTEKQNAMKKLWNDLKKIKTDDLLPFLIEKSKKNPSFGIVLIAITALALFTAGKNFGRLLYLILH